MQIDQQIKIVKDDVIRYFNEYQTHEIARRALKLRRLDELEQAHAIHIATSILCTKWEIRPGGSFVQAIVDNDLQGAIFRADNINADLLHFYCAVLVNIRKPDELK